MKLTAQYLLFLVIGGVQIVVDTSLFAAILVFTGEPLLGNVMSRGTAATVGFILNRKYTFNARSDGKASGQALRYILLWFVLTMLSTSLIAAGDAVLTGVTHHREWMIGLKILIESAMTVPSFLGMRHGVFRGVQSD
jgi:putative flippase GtrA